MKKINTLTPEQAALEFARQHPEAGQFRAARELGVRGIKLSPSGVRLIWKRHGLETSYHRLMAVKRERGASSMALSESQHDLLQRVRISRRLLSLTGRPQTESSSPARREHLIAAAARVFGKKGYEGASLKEICGAAGILPGSLYYYFRSKENLFIAVHAEGFRQINDSLDRALEGANDPWQRLEAACTAHLVQLLNGNDIPFMTGRVIFQIARPALQRRLNDERDRYEQRFRDLINALDLAPEINRSLLRLTLLGALNWTRLWYRAGQLSPAQIAHHLVNDIVRRSSAAR